MWSPCENRFPARPAMPIHGGNFTRFVPGVVLKLICTAGSRKLIHYLQKGLNQHLTKTVKNSFGFAANRTGQVKTIVL